MNLEAYYENFGLEVTVSSENGSLPSGIKGIFCVLDPYHCLTKWYSEIIL